MANPHSYQMLDGSDVIVQIAKLPLPSRVEAIRDPSTGILTYINEPELWTTGSTDGKLIEVVGSMEFNTTFGKTNRTFRLFNDSGWEQDKITGRNWSATSSGMFVRGLDPQNPDLEDSFKIVIENAQLKEEEVYIKFKKLLGLIPASAPLSVTANDTNDQFTFGAAQSITQGEKIRVAASTVPAGLTANTDYYAIVISPTVIQLAASYAGAVATTPVPIDITSAGTGVTLIRQPRRRFQIEAGNAKVLNFSDQATADGILSVNATFKGQGAFIYGFEQGSI